jgi:magnesium-transporting ATPase (P-type)
LSLYLFCSGFLRNFFHLFAVITLWVATVLAFLGEWKQPGQGMAKIGYAIIAVIVVSGLFSFGQEYVSSEPRTLAALRKLLPQEVDVMRDGKVRITITRLSHPQNRLREYPARPAPRFSEVRCLRMKAKSRQLLQPVL